MLKKLDENEIKLLSIISRFVFTNRQASTDRIIYLMGIKIPALLSYWQQSADNLIGKGILKYVKTDDYAEYEITEYGKSYAQHVVSNNCLDFYFYNEFYRRAEESKAHSEFCRLVYGKDLCQHGMLDMDQLHRLIEVSKLDNNSKVLELGCGNGFITEYISDRTLCHVTGIDIAVEAIEHAKDRTKDKCDRLFFQTMSMDSLDYKENSFDAIISIDTLYFVKDLESVLKSIYRVLKPDGTVFIFYHVPLDVVNRSASDPAQNSMLGSALNHLNYNYRIIEFTEENKKHWELKKQILLELKPKFEEEDNMFLYNNRMAECIGNLGEFYRFLYIVRPK